MLITLILSVIKKKDADVAEYETEYGSPLKTDLSGMITKRSMPQSMNDSTFITIQGAEYRWLSARLQ